MKKINYRPILFVFIFLCIGLITGKLILSKNLLEIIFLVTFIILLVVFLIYNRLFKQIILVSIAFLFGVSLFFLEYNIYSSKDINNCTFTGTIDSTDILTQNVNLVIKNVSINNENKLYKILVNVSGNNLAFINFNKGDTIKFNCDLKSINLIKNDTINTSYYKKSIKYQTSIKTDVLSFIGNKLNIFDKLKLKIEDNLNNNFSYDNASLSNAILYGNTNNLSASLKENYRLTGISHLLAISGLHIGLLVGILMFVLKKVNKILKTIIISIILVLYCFLCGFAFSVVRASVMAIIVLLAGYFGCKNDILTSISVAGILLILVKPLSFFDLSFLLSFGSVFGIILLNKPIKNLFLKLKFKDNKILDAICVSISSQIFILPIVAKYFNSISIVGIFINVIVIPIFAIGYYFLFCILILSLIVPIFSKLFVIPDFIFTIVNFISSFLAKYSFASIKIFGIGFIGTTCYYLLIALSSKYVNFNKKFKLITMCLLVTFLVPSVIISNIPTIKNNTVTSVENNYIVKKDNQYTLKVYDNINKSNTNNLIEDIDALKIRKISDIMLLSKKADKKYLLKLLNEYNIKNVYINKQNYDDYNYLESYNNYNLILLQE